MQADTAISALVPSNRVTVEKTDQTGHFPKIVIRHLGGSRKDATHKKVATHRTHLIDIQCQGGYDYSGTRKAADDAIAVAKAVEGRLCTLHNTLGNIGTSDQVQIKSMAITDARTSLVDIDPTIKPTAGSEAVYTYTITAEFTYKQCISVINNLDSYYKFASSAGIELDSYGSNNLSNLGAGFVNDADRGGVAVFDQNETDYMTSVPTNATGAAAWGLWANFD